MKKYENFKKSLKNLSEGLKTNPPYSVVEQAGIVALFEICFEQSWKLMKELLESQSAYPDRIASPKAIIKLAYQCGMTDDEEGWLQIQKTRNLLAHTYSDEDSWEAIEQIRAAYLPLFEKLKHEIEENWLPEKDSGA